MLVFKDICFCANKNCTKRNKCARALENYTDEEKSGKYFSISEFNCSDKNKTNMFIKSDEQLYY